MSSRCTILGLDQVPRRPGYGGAAQRNPVIVAANKGKSAEIEALVKQAGGSILKTIPEIDYVRGILAHG